MSLHVPHAGFGQFCKALQQTFLGKTKKQNKTQSIKLVICKENNTAQILSAYMA